MRIRPIRDEGSRLAAIRRYEELENAEAGTPEGDEAETWAALIEIYERECDPIEPPTALEAIRFRMDQLDLEPRDLIPDLGSKSRVSEVLSGQRQLTIDMIRSLHERWGIPLSSLIRSGETKAKANEPPAKPVLKLLRELNVLHKDESYADLCERVGVTPGLAYRRRITPKSDASALEAWCVAVLDRSLSKSPCADKCPEGSLDRSLLERLARLSSKPNGVLQAADLLADSGICFVTVPHFPGTHLDGAAIKREDGAYILALTLRHDRIDNFWFSLLHEAAHIVLGHLDQEKRFIMDDLEIDSSDDIEREADKAASDALVPPDLWARFNANEYTSTAQIVNLAQKAAVHPAVIAGRWRKEMGNYRKFSFLLGHGTVRPLLSDQST